MLPSFSSLLLLLCSGPMVVLKQMLSHIWTTDKVNFLDRLSCSYFFFRCGSTLLFRL